YLFAAAPALFNNSPHRDQLLSAQFFIGIGLGQSSLNVLIARLRDLDSHVERKNAGFNGRDEPFLTLFQKGPDHVNVFDAYADFWCNFAIAVSAAAQGADVLQ